MNDRAFSAIVLAGSRAEGDAVARAAGVPCKALAPVAGRAMLLRVLDALEASGRIEHTLVVGLPEDALDANREIAGRLAGPGITLVAGGSTPSLSTGAALAVAPADKPVLVTTADHALLNVNMLRHFVDQAESSDCDALVGLAPHEIVEAAYPGVRRTVHRFRDGAFCGCNLFAFLTPAGRELAGFWRRVEQHRKKPLRVVGVLGLWSVIRFALGTLSLRDALARLSMRAGARVGMVSMPVAEAAIDVDSIDDWRLVERIAKGPGSL